MKKIKGRAVCPQCNAVLAVREIHEDCFVAIDIKEAAAFIMSILEKGKISLCKLKRGFRRIQHYHSPKRVIEIGRAFYESLVGYYRQGVFATASAEQVIRPLLNGLEKLGRVIRKVETFQGRKVLVP